MLMSFPDTRKTLTRRYSNPKRKKWFGPLFVLLLIMVVLGFVLACFFKDGFFHQLTGDRPISKKNILTMWQGKEWDSILASCISSLDAIPLDPFYLGFAGLAAYYKGIELPEGEGRFALMAESVIALRKALVCSGFSSQRVPRAELEYVLGKAYFYKGISYWDSSTRWLESSIADGYIGEDTNEYLAVTYAGLDKIDTASIYFNAALKTKHSDFLLIAASKTYAKIGDWVRAESLLLEALSLSRDVMVREECRFLLMDLYENQSDFIKAEEQLQLALSENAESAEAHYRLGIIYQKKGDSVRARAEWRKAIEIDPMHSASRQKLSEKL